MHPCPVQVSEGGEVLRYLADPGGLRVATTSSVVEAPWPPGAPPEQQQRALFLGNVGGSHISALLL